MQAPDGAEDRTPPDPGATSTELVRVTPTGYLAPREISAELKRRIDEALVRVREQRGNVVHMPEDVHEAIRVLATWDAEIAEYEQAMKAGRDHIRGAMEEELLEVAAVEGRDGIPSKMIVPDHNSKILVEPVFKTDRDFDMDQVLGQLVALVEDEWKADHEADGQKPLPADYPEAFATEVAQRFIGLYTGAKPSVKAINALAALAGARKQDTPASIIKRAVGESRQVYQDRVTFKVEAA